jgi:hypothetical protein
MGACADGDTGDRDIEARRTTKFAEGGELRRCRGVGPEGYSSPTPGGKKGAKHGHDERRVFPSPSGDLPAAGKVLPGPRGRARLVRHGPGVQGQGGRNGRRLAAHAAPRARAKLGRRLRLDDPLHHPRFDHGGPSVPAADALGRNLGLLQAVRRHASDRATDSRSVNRPDRSCQRALPTRFFRCGLSFRCGPFASMWASCNIPTISYLGHIKGRIAWSHAAVG